MQCDRFHRIAKQYSHYERFHIQNQKLQDSKTIFSMCLSSFKEYVGTFSNEFKRLFGQDNIVGHLSVGTMIITTDNKWDKRKKVTNA